MSEHEEWLPVVGYEGLYEVSTWGRLVRLKTRITRSDGREQWSQSGPISGSPNQTGHIVVRLYRDGKPVNRQLHRIVCEAFHGLAPEGKPMVLHWDDDPSNNRPENLRWGDGFDNQQDSVRNRSHVNSRKTRCKRGHPLEGENLRILRNGNRECKECGNIIRAEWRALQSPTGLTESDSRHGTASAYTIYKCRCKECVKGNSERVAEAKKKRYAQGLSPNDKRHGTTGGYKTWGCRCDLCRKSNADAEANRKRRRAER